jgi:hypothetical protein
VDVRFDRKLGHGAAMRSQQESKSGDQEHGVRVPAARGVLE